MRTTVTLDPDTAALVQQRMREHRVTFKQALNDAVRAGAADSVTSAHVYVVPVADMGLPTVNLDRALTLAGDLEDEELLRKMRLGE